MMYGPAHSRFSTLSSSSPFPSVFGFLQIALLLLWILFFVFLLNIFVYWREDDREKEEGKTERTKVEKSQHRSDSLISLSLLTFYPSVMLSLFASLCLTNSLVSFSSHSLVVRTLTSILVRSSISLLPISLIDLQCYIVS